MKKTLLMAGALLALTAGIASAQGGINLSWTDCSSAGAGSRTFACTANGSVGALYGSVTPPTQLDQLNGEESEAIIQTNQAALSNWWHLEAASAGPPPTPAGCRAGALVFSMDFTGNSGPCTDPWGGQGFGGLDYQPGYLAPNHGRLRTAGAIAGSTVMTPDQEWYIWKVTILGSKSVGTGSCAGCTDGACIVFVSQKLTEPLGVGDYVVTNPMLRQYVTFQAGGTLAGQCPAATPTQSRTWGSVKSLYR
jgi:hypothetical protein